MSIILVSGGLDSATSLAWALENTAGPHIPLSFYYGQRHSREQESAARLCEHYRLPAPRTINLAQAFAVIGGSSLTSGLVHGNPSIEAVERTPSELPPTFVPGRNLIFLSVAAAVGYVEKVYDVVGGWNALDYSGYPDCRPAFFELAESAAGSALGLAYEVAQGEYSFAGDNKKDTPRITIHRPLVNMTKKQIIQEGLHLNVPYGLTWSCYSGGDRPCGVCDSCQIRANGFSSLGLTDPALA